jgi:putative transposase
LPPKLTKFKDVFWANGYFIALCGGVTVEHLKQYIDEQDRPTE